MFHFKNSLFRGKRLVAKIWKGTQSSMKSHALLVSAGLLALICLMRFEFARQKEIWGDISFRTWQE
jgi:hypothetical protein